MSRVIRVDAEVLALVRCRQADALLEAPARRLSVSDALRELLGAAGVAVYSAQQRRVLDTPGVEIVGIDARGRTVVEALAGIPQSRQRWALLRSGDPADVVEPVADVRARS